MPASAIGSMPATCSGLRAQRFTTAQTRGRACELADLGTRPRRVFQRLDDPNGCQTP